jgi:hypothetical protein
VRVQPWAATLQKSDLLSAAGGDWAGNVFAGQGCGSSCTGMSPPFDLTLPAHHVADYVNNNPGAFSQAYWDIAGVRVYE